MKNAIFGTLAVLFLSAMFVFADEGMWPYNALPLKILKSKYNFTPTPEWTDHLMKSSARFNSGGSGSFVSSDGLVLTNHHVAADTIEKISTPEKDYYKNGFYAKSLAEEIPAPDLEINQLQKIEDVTDTVKSVIKPDMAPAEAYKAVQGAINTIERDAQARTGLKAEVVTLYKGAIYNLYLYKVYTDIRVVFAPEFSMAFYGGDPDNFEYPRYDLDMAIVRVYENGRPAQIENFLKWSKVGAQNDELVFVSGHPGATERLNTVASLEFRRDYLLPFVLDLLQRSEAAIQTYMKRGSEEARHAQGDLFGVQNSRKVYVGRLAGLRAGNIIKEKQLEEKKLRAKVESDPQLKKYSKAWDQIAKAQEEYKKILVTYYMLEKQGGFKSRLFGIARKLVRLAYENQKPDVERLPEYRSANRKTLELSLFSAAPIYTEFEEFYFATSLQIMREKLGSDNPIVKKVLNHSTPEQLAKALVQGTELKNPSVRRKIAEGGIAAIESSVDPMILMALLIDDESRSALKAYNDKVAGPEQEAYPQIAQTIYAINGSSAYPDATFSLRLSFGTVSGYEQNKVQIPPMTTIGGAFEYEAKHEGKEPYRLPNSWRKSKSALDLSTPLNFVSTADIIGGNSGSPVVNKDGELVGLIFDGNIQSLVLDYGYEDVQARAVSVHSSGILEALKKVYHVDTLVDHLGR